MMKMKWKSKYILLYAIWTALFGAQNWLLTRFETLNSCYFASESSFCWRKCNKEKLATNLSICDVMFRKLHQIHSKNCIRWTTTTTTTTFSSFKSTKYTCAWINSKQTNKRMFARRWAKYAVKMIKGIKQWTVQAWKQCFVQKLEITVSVNDTVCRSALLLAIW